MAWKFGNGWLATAGEKGGGLAEMSAPRAGRVAFSVRFKPLAAEKGATAGIGIGDDDANGWSLLFQVSGETGERAILLGEALKGRWGHPRNLRVEYEKRIGVWQVGRWHTLSLALDSAGITGTVRDEQGGLLYAIRYLFTGEASRIGRPNLFTNRRLPAIFAEADAEMSEPAPEKPTGTFPAYDAASFMTNAGGSATGFFHVERKPDGRWWMIDPLGRGFVLLAVEHVNYHGSFDEKTHRSAYLEANNRRFASKKLWAGETLGRLRAWGFNTLGWDCEGVLLHRGLPHTSFLGFGYLASASGDDRLDILPHSAGCGSGFPNVFDPAFASYCRFHARRNCYAQKDDPWLVGYFLDNELGWEGLTRPDSGLFDAVLKKSPAHTAKLALRDFLLSRAGGQMSAFNKLWGTSLEKPDDVLSLGALPGDTAARRAAKLDFLRFVADRYFAIVTSAVRQFDPHHLILGTRFTASVNPVVWEAAGKACDVVSFNNYPWVDLDRNMVDSAYQDAGAVTVADLFARQYQAAKRPMMITEWSFPALDSGLPCLHGAGQRFRTQAGRAAAASLFARTMLATPAMVGYDYFMWVDNPGTGVEDCNYGLVNEQGVPYAALTSMFSALQREAGEWKVRPLPEPCARTAEVPSARAFLGRFANKGLVAGEIRAESSGGSFRIETPAGLTLAGRTGDSNLVSALTWRGSFYGTSGAMLSVGGPRWFGITRLAKARASIEAGCGILEATGTGGSGDVAFEVTHRLTVLPDRPVILCELVEIRNTACAPLECLGAYFPVTSPFKDAPRGQINLWGNGPFAAWKDAATGRFIGVVAPKESGAVATFWTDSDGVRHSDAKYLFQPSLTIRPGASYRPARPCYFACFLGEGGDEAIRALRLAGGNEPPTPLL